MPEVKLDDNVSGVILDDEDVYDDLDFSCVYKLYFPYVRASSGGIYSAYDILGRFVAEQVTPPQTPQVYLTEDRNGAAPDMELTPDSTTRFHWVFRPEKIYKTSVMIFVPQPLDIVAPDNLNYSVQDIHNIFTGADTSPNLGFLSFLFLGQGVPAWFYHDSEISGKPYLVATPSLVADFKKDTVLGSGLLNSAPFDIYDRDPVIEIKAIVRFKRSISAQYSTIDSIPLFVFADSTLTKFTGVTLLSGIPGIGVIGHDESEFFPLELNFGKKYELIVRFKTTGIEIEIDNNVLISTIRKYKTGFVTSGVIDRFIISPTGIMDIQEILFNSYA